MARTGSTGYAFNRTRQVHLATRLKVAGSHWSRFRGLMCTSATQFRAGDGLWIVPCRGVHTFAMNFPIDVLYLSANLVVVHMEQNLKPWRLGRVTLAATSVVELPSGTLGSTGTKLGDTIEISLEDSGQPAA